jgi:hypothetical protein
MSMARFAKSLMQATMLASALVASCATVAASANQEVIDYLLNDHPELDELAHRAAIKHLISGLFVRGDYESLETIANTYRVKKLKTSSGLDKLNHFYSAMDDVLSLSPQNESHRPELEKQVAKWLESYPTSTSAHSAHAQMLLQHAWSIRGKGYSHTVKPENWAPFKEYVQKANTYLNDNAKYSSNDPRWDMMKLSIATLQGMEVEVSRR